MSKSISTSGTRCKIRDFSSTFLRIALGVDVYQDGLQDTEPDAIMEYLGWDAHDKPILEAIIRTIQHSSPYLPRGGYSRKNPHALIKAFCTWLEHQQEPLQYDTGEQSGRREIILASGGIHETIRILLLALSTYLEITPAKILCYRCELLPSLKSIRNLLFEDLDTDERVAREQIEHLLINTPGVPTFMLIGGLLGEETRRKLRILSIEHPLYFVEVNNAPNHLSLAREAKLVQRVMRLVSPAIFAPRLQTLSTVFIAGDADYLSVMENVHFNFKGTPSASEVEFLIYLLEQKQADIQAPTHTEIPHGEPSFDGLGLGIRAELVLPQLAERAEWLLDHFLNERANKLADSIGAFEGKTVSFAQRIQDKRIPGIIDEFSTVDAKDLFDQFIQNAHIRSWCQTLQRSFLSAFVKHQPQYKLEACMVVSGSARTALGILGLHCDITEVVIPDLSWSYEQCFPKGSCCTTNSLIRT